MNTKQRVLTIGLFFTMVLPAAALGGSIGQSQRITGSVDKLIQINPQRIIENVDPETVGLPKTFIIDLKARTLRGTPDSRVRRVVHIARIDHIEDKLILLGADAGVAGTSDGLGWSLAIEKKTGKAVLSAAGSGIAFVVFGTCTASPTARRGPMNDKQQN